MIVSVSNAVGFYKFNKRAQNFKTQIFEFLIRKQIWSYDQGSEFLT